MTPATSILRRALPLALGGVLLTTGPARAQDPDRTDDECVCIEADGPTLLTRSLLRPNRARIGVMLGAGAEVDGQTGVRVADVVDGGPAADAGLRDDDVITAIDGQALDDDPGDALVRAMRDVEPGDTVTLTYYRDGARRTAEVVTAEARSLRVFSGDGFDVRVVPHMDLERFRGAGEMGVVSPRTLLRRLSPVGLELAQLNPALGEYFGTDEGVLVLDIDDDAGLDLRPGDVILAIDGRSVHDPAHLRAILGSYRPDEEITFRVVRRQHELEVAGTIGRRP